MITTVFPLVTKVFPLVTKVYNSFNFRFWKCDTHTHKPSNSNLKIYWEYLCKVGYDWSEADVRVAAIGWRF